MNVTQRQKNTDKLNPVPLAQFLAQARHAEDWLLNVLDSLEADGFVETVPGVFERGSTVVAL